jgi:aspartate ammonia-lyase
MEIPADAYYGIQTVRAMENFPVSGLQEDPAFIAAYVMLKKAAALTNIELGVLDEERGRAIVQTADEALSWASAVVSATAVGGDGVRHDLGEVARLSLGVGGGREW